MVVTESEAVREARAEAQAARQRLLATARELQHRAAPRTLARDAWSGAKEKGAGLAEQAVDVVSKRPVTVGAVAAAVALFAAREPLLDLAGRLFVEKKDRMGDGNEPQPAERPTGRKRSGKTGYSAGRDGHRP